MIKLIRIHPFFWIILVGSVFLGQFIEIITLFSIVMIHEIGHYAAARIFNWRVTEIQILPFGGVAKVDESGNVPIKEEMIVALAGPLQNGMMIVVALILFKWGVWEAEWTTFFVNANMTIALFNLLPIVPLDGGRLMQCLLSMWMRYRTAIDRSHQISLLISAAILIISIGPGRLPLQTHLFGLSLFFIFSNWEGLRHAHFQYIRFLLSRHHHGPRKPGERAFPLMVSPTTLIVDALMQMYRGKYHVFYIAEDDKESPKIVPEERILYFYFQMKQHRSAIGQLLS